MPGGPATGPVRMGPRGVQNTGSAGEGGQSAGLQGLWVPSSRWLLYQVGTVGYRFPFFFKLKND